jgi:hypothetical protein
VFSLLSLDLPVILAAWPAHALDAIAFQGDCLFVEVGAATSQIWGHTPSYKFCGADLTRILKILLERV